MSTRKSPKRVAAGKKAARTRKRNASRGRGTQTTTTTTNTRRRRTTKKTFLSEAMNPVKAQKSVSFLLSGALGYYAGRSISELMPNETPSKKALILAAGSFAIGNFMNLPGVAAGMIGSSVEHLIQHQQMLRAQGMSENANFVDPETLSELSQLAQLEEDMEQFESLPEFITPGMSEGANIYGGIPFHEL